MSKNISGPFGRMTITMDMIPSRQKEKVKVKEKEKDAVRVAARAAARRVSDIGVGAVVGAGGRFGSCATNGSGVVHVCMCSLKGFASLIGNRRCIVAISF